MAGADNLNGKGFDARTTSEAREMGRKGGIASGAARRRKKAIKTMLSQMLSTKVPEEGAGKLKPLGIESEDADYQAAVGAALIKKAMSGNVQAIQLLVNLTGDDPYVKARQSEVKARHEEVKLKREELEHKKRMDEARLERDTSGDDAASIWLDAVLAGEDSSDA